VLFVSLWFLSLLESATDVQIFKIIVAIILFAALQGVVTRFVRRFEFVDLTLILTVYLSLKRKPLQGMLVGTGAGLAYDILTGPLLGASGFVKTIIGFIISSINVHFAIDRKLMRLFVLVLASVGNVLLFVGIYLVFNFNDQVPLPMSSTPGEIAKLTAWQAAGNLILGFFLFPVLDRAFVEQPYVGSRRTAHW
jgi:rod shape-determining protein MreD